MMTVLEPPFSQLSIVSRPTTKTTVCSCDSCRGTYKDATQRI